MALLWAVTTSTLAAVSFTLTVDGVFWAREVELVGVAVACAAAVVVFKAPQAASSVMTAIKKAAQKKRFIEKTPPQFQSLASIGNDAATCHRDLYFLYCSTAGALRQDAAKKS